MCPFFVVLNTFDPQFFIRGLIDSSNELIIAKGSIQLIQPNTKNRFSSLYYFIFHLHFHSTSHFIVSICLFSPLLSCLLYFIFSNYLLINLSTFCPFFFFFLLSNSTFLFIFSPCFLSQFFYLYFFSLHFSHYFQSLYSHSTLCFIFFKHFLFQFLFYSESELRNRTGKLIDKIERESNDKAGRVIRVRKRIKQNRAIK